MEKAIFLDRDGVINVDKGYTHKITNFEFIPGSIEALKRMQDRGYLLIVITNQSGIGRGYYTEKDFQKLNKHMLVLLLNEGVKMSKVYYCLHDPADRCSCRKPNTQFMKEAEKEFGIELNKSYMIGDKTSDIKMGKKAGCMAILVQTGRAGKDKQYKVRPDFIAKDLYSAAEIIIKNESKKA